MVWGGSVRAADEVPPTLYSGFSGGTLSAGTSIKEPPNKDPAPKDEQRRFAKRKEAMTAIAKFTKAYKARGVPQADRIWVRQSAMEELAKTNHPLVADKLRSIAAKSRSSDLRACALVALASMTQLPAYVGELLCGLFDERRVHKDTNAHLAIATAFGKLPYVPTEGIWTKLLTHKDVGVQKAAYGSVEKLRDVRMLQHVIRTMAEMDRAEASGDQGGTSPTPGGAGTPGSLGGTGRPNTGPGVTGARGGRTSKRTQLRYTLYRVIKTFTGEELERAAQVEAWIAAHTTELNATYEALDARLQKQAQMLRETQAWAKAKK